MNNLLTNEQREKIDACLDQQINELICDAKHSNTRYIEATIVLAEIRRNDIINSRLTDIWRMLRSIDENFYIHKDEDDSETIVEMMEDIRDYMTIK